MKKSFVKHALSSALMLASASLWAQTQPTTQQSVSTSSTVAPTQKTSGIELQYIDSSVAPQQNFYEHINGLWLKNTAIPDDKARWGTFDILHEASIDQLHKIVDELAQKNPSQGSTEQKVATLYANFMDEATIESLGIRPIQAEINRVDAIKNKKQFASLFAHFSRIGVESPFDAGIGQDNKDSTKIIAGIGQSGLGLPDRDYYLKDDAKFKEIRAEYLKYIEKTLTLAGDPSAAKKAQDILKLETQIAKAQWDNVQNRDPQKTYNIYKTQDLNKLSPSIHWQDYLVGQELNDKIKTIQVTQPSYFKGLSPIIDQNALDVWKAYFKFHLVNDFSSLLSKNFVDNQFDFYSRKLNDVKQQRERWKRGVQLVNGTLGESLGKVYVEKYFSPEKKQRMEQLVQNLLKAYKQSIEQLDWMSPTTKVEAQKKLTSLVVKIGYPNKWRDYSNLEIKQNDLVGNVIRSREFEHKFAINKLGKPVDREEWGMTPQTVNAYYNPSMNEIVFPAAILQPPFFDMNADDAVNYGGIGAVIGHEISHGFDDQGSQFDSLGNMKNWWTKQDHEKFKAKTSALVAQYSAYEPVPGFHINGELTLGENIADNSGLAIAYKAYKLSLNGQAAPVLDNLTGDQRFYAGWAQVWRGKTREAKQIELIKTDPHSPGQVRGNGTVLNQPAFYDAFQIKEGDKMYLAPNKRVIIW